MGFSIKNWKLISTATMESALFENMSIPLSKSENGATIPQPQQQHLSAKERADLSGPSTLNGRMQVPDASARSGRRSQFRLQSSPGTPVIPQTRRPV
ncbi:hypothetical protein ColTof3_08555 [Colletotrichum tofieldiae]|nr:hypothetical protein ColTof3_08555 [Colletotrichum tofieldiae]